MKKISSYLANFTGPSAGFSEGQLKDDPGGSLGSGLTEQTGNDWLYSIYALAKKYLSGGTVSDTDESETDSDNMDAIEILAGVQNPNVLEWLVGTTYAQDDHVMYFGAQFVSMIAGNIGNDPYTNLDKWLPCFERNDALIKWQKGDDIQGGFDILHDFRDVGYRQNYPWGKYNYGGDAGKNYEGFGVHLDGTQITGDATLVAIFDVGGGGEYHLLDIIAPDVVGVRTLLDARGRVGANVDAGGGDRVAVGSVQEDALQRITGSFKALIHKPTSAIFGSHVGVFTSDNSFLQQGVGISGTQTFNDRTNFDNDDSVAPNAAKTDDAETRMKNYSVGISSVLVLNALP